MAINVTDYLIIDDNKNVSLTGLINSPTIPDLINVNVIEVASRKFADLLMEVAIISESNTRESEDTILQNNKNNLVNNRKNGDTALWLAIAHTWTNAMPDDSGCNCPTCTQGCN